MSNNILFINSYQRSGSTLLGMLLGRYSGLTYLGEVRNVHQYLVEDKPCFNGDLLKDNLFWGEVFENMKEDPFEVFTKAKIGWLSKKIKSVSSFVALPLFDEITGLLTPSLIRDKKAYANIRKYYDAANVENSKWLIDSSHRTSEARSHHYKLKENFKVIFLIRDGRGVVNSIRNRNLGSIESASKAWRNFIVGARRYHRRLADDQILTVKYEDLCADCSKEMSRITKFLGVDQKYSLSSVQNFVGGSSTIRNAKSTDFKLRLDEKWRESLNLEDVKIFEKIAGSVNYSLGYC